MINLKLSDWKKFWKKIRYYITLDRVNGLRSGYFYSDFLDPSVQLLYFNDAKAERITKTEPRATGVGAACVVATREPQRRKRHVACKTRFTWRRSPAVDRGKLYPLASRENVCKAATAHIYNISIFTGEVCIAFPRALYSDCDRSQASLFRSISVSVSLSLSLSLTLSLSLSPDCFYPRAPRDRRANVVGRSNNNNNLSTHLCTWHSAWNISIKYLKLLSLINGILDK